GSLVYASGALPRMLSSPTRRSSDLLAAVDGAYQSYRDEDSAVFGQSVSLDIMRELDLLHPSTDQAVLSLSKPLERIIDSIFSPRSEEHTSELQSREKLVCRLLLEKK